MDVFVLQDDLATVMTEYRCRFTEDVANKYQSYIKSATHRSGECILSFLVNHLFLVIQ